jgi:hypothetical protein
MYVKRCPKMETITMEMVVVDWRMVAFFLVSAGGILGKNL